MTRQELIAELIRLRQLADDGRDFSCIAYRLESLAINASDPWGQTEIPN